MDAVGDGLRRFGARTVEFSRMLWGADADTTPWIRRIALVVFGTVVVLPVLIVLLYRFVPPPTTPLAAATWLTEGAITKEWVPLARMSPALAKAVIAAEDNKFCSHSGFDWEAIDKAMERNARGRTLRGASTISQQTAKNLFLPPSRNWLRKGFEAYFTVLIEGLWPKRRIMEVYLNIIEWGPRQFGAEAASRINFGKSASAITVADAARLAAILPNPRVWRANNPGPYVARRSGEIAARMGQVTRDRLDACLTR